MAEVAVTMQAASEFVAQAVAQVTIRPRKLGYLVQANDRGQLREAIDYASTEWGGIGHPIVPVRARRRVDPGLWQILELLRPEVLIDYVGVDDSLSGALRTRVGCVVLPAKSLVYDEPGIHLLVTVPPGTLRARTLFTPGPKAPLHVVAAVGQVPTDTENERLWKETGAVFAEVSSPLDLLDAQLEAPSPLWVARQHFGTWSHEIGGAPLIIFTDARPSPARIAHFWNVRALGAPMSERVLWLPLDSISDPGVAERIRDECLNKRQTTPDLLLLGPNAPELSAAARTIGFTEHKGTRATSTLTTSGRDLSKTPLSYWTRIDPRGFVLGNRSEGVRAPLAVTVTRPVTHLHFASHIAFNPSIGGRIRVDVDGIDAISWPRRQATARLIAPNTEWTGNGLGFVTSPTRNYQFELRVPDAPDVLTACLRDAGWGWTPSDKGRYANALLGSVPGRLSIPSLHDRLSLRVVRTLTSLTSRKAEQAVRAALPATVSDSEIRAAIAQVAPALSPRWMTANEIASGLPASPRTSRVQVVAALSLLLEDRLVLRAFRFRCPNCGLTTHVPLGRAGDRVVCDGCAAERVLRGSSGEPEIGYGLNTLLDRAADQDCHGHLPVQDWMRVNRGLVWSVPGVDLENASGQKREIDVLGLSRTELLVSEVKNSVGGFTDDVLIKTAELARDLGADELVLAALDDWPAARKAEAVALSLTRVAKVVAIGLSDL